MAAKEPEPEPEEDAEERQRLADRVLSIFEDAIYWAIAVMLVVGSGALLVSQFNTMLRLREMPANTVMLEILDGLLLIFIFVELLYAVRTSLRSHEIAVEPFLIVGMLAGIKEIVVLSVEAAKLLDNGPNFARAVVEIGVLGAVVLILAVAAYILRGRRGREHGGTRAVKEETSSSS
ncbi:phosphate-starvation-inducible PsiE family protein [Mycolicibacterium pyrenivorans]|uniref:phosphate-starvation-inducible PsiE family protein n=1 Tax=Mycolicibacterium pyrenivorans TaxID=187102 RepID=UPI0021F2B361|nr:phosphate-starvation-inducible PsiE family protein [Mycolicibacterium pyrenivorans]MCV7151032.1 phosphate-starvation-inducible PsiE family protein [Mycolicibacterium pyrenivorans]